MNPKIEIADIIIENFCRNMLEWNSGKYTPNDFYKKVKSLHKKYKLSEIKDFGLQIFLTDTLIWYWEQNVRFWLAQIYKVRDDSKIEDMIDKINETSSTYLLQRLKNFRDRNDYLDFQEFYYDQKDYEFRLNATRELYEICLYKTLMQGAKEGVLK